MRQLFTITFLILTLTFTGNAQNKEQIATIMADYSNNYGNPEYSHEYADTVLNPALLKLEQLTCEGNDFGLLNDFLKMLSKTKGSANEVPANVLGGIFICKPEAVDKYLTQVYKDKELVYLLEFGFENRTYDKKDRVKNYSKLKERLNRLLKKED